MTYLACPACQAKNGLRLVRQTQLTVHCVSPSLADLAALRTARAAYLIQHPTCRGCGVSVPVVLTRDKA